MTASTTTETTRTLIIIAVQLNSQSIYLLFKVGKMERNLQYGKVRLRYSDSTSITENTIKYI